MKIRPWHKLFDIRREGEIAQTNLDAQAVGAGAFGGSRAAVAQGELGRNVMDQQARTAAQMRAAGFESAAERARMSEAQQARQQALAQGLGALGGQRLGAAELIRPGDSGRRRFAFGSWISSVRTYWMRHVKAACSSCTSQSRDLRF